MKKFTNRFNSESVFLKPEYDKRRHGYTERKIRPDKNNDYVELTTWNGISAKEDLWIKVRQYGSEIIFTLPQIQDIVKYAKQVQKIIK